MGPKVILLAINDAEISVEEAKAIGKALQQVPRIKVPQGTISPSIKGSRQQMYMLVPLSVTRKGAR